MAEKTCLIFGRGFAADSKARRAFQNYILEQLERYENYGDDFCNDICDCCGECKCYGACGTEHCVDRLIDWYGGEDYEDN